MSGSDSSGTKITIVKRPVVEAEEMTAQSPNSISSLSSINSNNSTEKLIKSLSVQHLDDAAKHLHSTSKIDSGSKYSEIRRIEKVNQEPSGVLAPKRVVSSGSGSASGASLSGTSTGGAAGGPREAHDARNGEMSKSERVKPIKFRVRKVSHDTIKQSDFSVRSPTSRDKNEESEKTRKQLEDTESKYDQYNVRIVKINKEIDFLTNLLPPYNVEIDYATRTKITKAIEKLRMKQDEVEKKKYRLGIVISRLWRELDDSNIWVRSVSNS